MSIQTVAVSAAAAVGYYATQLLIELRYGTLNTDIESDLDNNGLGANVTKYTDVLAATDRWIDRELRSNGYAYPLPTTSADFGVLQDIAVDYARALLHMPRGAGDQQSTGIAGQMQKLMQSAMNRLQVILHPTNSLDCAKSSTTRTGPEVGEQHHRRHGYGGYFDPWQTWG